MGKRLAAVILSVLTVLTFSVLVSALPPEVEHALHELNIVKIENKGNLSRIWDLRDAPDSVDIVKLTKLPEDQFSSTQMEVLKNWVRNGGTLWCDPARRKILEEFEIETEKWDEGWSKVQIIGSHPVLTGVEELKLYVIGQFIYGIDVPLLTFKGRVIAGVKRYGSGMVLAVNTWDINRDYRDGERFLANLKEYGAGYSVPVASGVQPGGRFDRIVLKNQETLVGHVESGTFNFRTPYGQFNFYQGEVSTIRFGDQGVLRLNRGDKLIGELIASQMNIRLKDGGWRTVRVDRIELIDFEK